MVILKAKFSSLKLVFVDTFDIQKTTAHRRYVDDVPPDIKQQRVHKMNELFRREAETLNKAQIGKEQLILVEGVSNFFYFM